MIEPSMKIIDVKPVAMYEVTVEGGLQLPYRIGYVPKVGELVCVNPVSRAIQHSVKECDCFPDIESVP